jgi:hypothetical protein
LSNRSHGAGIGILAGLRVLGVLVLLAAPAVGQTAPPDDDPARAVGWLAGCWEGTLQNGALYEELWLPPRGGTLVGLARMTRGDQVLSFEFMTITQDQGTLVYSAQPSGRPPTHFRAIGVNAREVVFENPDHDFPHRIIYRHTPPNELFARIEGDRDGELRGMDFPLRRTACPGAR